jgi:hypothetical protein
MKFRFQFLLSNGGSEWHTFEAATLKDATNNAIAWSKTAFKKDELLDFYFSYAVLPCKN